MVRRNSSTWMAACADVPEEWLLFRRSLVENKENSLYSCTSFTQGSSLSKEQYHGSYSPASGNHEKPFE